MFTIEELLLMSDALAAHYTRWQDEDMRKLVDKILIIRRHQELHEIMQEFLGVSRQYMLRMSDFEPEPTFPTKEQINTLCQLVYEGPNYNRPEDRSGAQRIPSFMKTRPFTQRLEYTDEELNAWNSGWVKLTEGYGAKCPDYEPGCCVCIAWELFEKTGTYPDDDEVSRIMEERNNPLPRFVPIKPTDITYGDITTEAMNRILRTIGNKEMG